MNKKTPVPAYRLISHLSNKLKVFINHYETPCRFLEPAPTIYLIFCIYTDPLLNSQYPRPNPTVSEIALELKRMQRTSLVQLVFLPSSLLLPLHLRFTVFALVVPQPRGGISLGLEDHSFLRTSSILGSGPLFIKTPLLFNSSFKSSK